MTNYVAERVVNTDKSLFQLSGRTYDTLKWVAMVFLPALGTLYFTVATLWGLPYVEQTLGTIAAVGTFLGILLGISTKQFWSTTEKTAGLLHIDTSGEADQYYLEVTAPLQDIPNKQAVMFKVVSS